MCTINAIFTASLCRLYGGCCCVQSNQKTGSNSIAAALGIAPRTTDGTLRRRQRAKIIDVRRRPLQKTRKRARSGGQRPEAEKADRVGGGAAQSERFTEEVQRRRIEQREKHSFRNAADDERRP